MRIIFTMYFWHVLEVAIMNSRTLLTAIINPR